MRPSIRKNTHPKTASSQTVSSTVEYAPIPEQPTALIPSEYKTGKYSPVSLRNTPEHESDSDETLETSFPSQMVGILLAKLWFINNILYLIFVAIMNDKNLKKYFIS